MTQNSTNETFHRQTNQTELARPVDANSVEFLNTLPPDLTTNPKRIWLEQITETLNFTVDGIDIHTLADRLDLPYINTRWYGAVGNGIADDRAAIQAALNAANAMGGAVVYSPKGTYIITDTLRIYENTVFLQDHNSTIKWGGGQFKAMMLNGELGNATYATAYNGDGNIVIMGGTFDMSGDTIPPPTPSDYGIVGLALAHAERIRIENVRFINNVNNHMIDFNSIQNGKIVNCTFEDSVTTGTNLYEPIQIDIATTGGFPYFGVDDNTPCNDVLVQGCSFRDCFSGVGAHATVVGIYQDNIRIIGNDVTNAFQYGIRAQSFRNSVVSSNTVNGTGQEHGIYVLACSNVVVDGNAVENIADHGITLVNSGAVRNDGVIVSNNQISSVGLSGTRVVQSDRVQFIGNSIRTAGNHGAFISDSNDVTISNNTIEGVSQATTNLFDGVNANGTSTGMIVSENKISNTGFVNNYRYQINTGANNSGVTTLDNIATIGATGRQNILGTNATINRERYLTAQLSVTTGVVNLSDDINNYRYVLILTGVPGSDTYQTAIARGFYNLGFRPGTDSISVNTFTGKFNADITTSTSITIIGTASDALRGIIGVI